MSASSLQLNIGLEGDSPKTAKQLGNELQRVLDIEKQLQNSVKEQNLLLAKQRQEVESLVAQYRLLAAPGGGGTREELAVKKDALLLAAQEIESMKQRALMTKEQLLTTQQDAAILRSAAQQKAEYEALTSQLRAKEAESMKYMTQVQRESAAEEGRIQQQRIKQLAEEQAARQEYSNLTVQMKQKEIEAEKMYYAAVAENEKRVLTAKNQQIRAGQVQATAEQENRKRTITLQNEQIKMGQLQSKAMEENAKMNVEAVGGLEKAWGKFGTVFMRVIDALAAFVIINTVTSVVRGFFESLIQSNQMLEETKARLSVLIPDVQELEGVWTKLKEVTITTPFQIEELAQASVQLKAFGVNIKENISALADWSAAVGKSAEETATAFGKIAQGSPRTALLLSTRGLSQAAFDLYLKQYGDRIVALNHLIEDTFGGTAVKVSATYKGILTNISDLWTLISQQLGQPLFEELKSDLQVIFDQLKKINEQTKLLTAIGTGIAVTVKTIIQSIIPGGPALAALASIKDNAEKLAEARMALKDSNKTDVEKLAIYEQINEQLVRMKDSITGTWVAYTSMGKDAIGVIDQHIAKNKEFLDVQRAIVQEHQRQLMLQHAEGNSIGDLETRQKVQALGLQKLLLQMAANFRNPKNWGVAWGTTAEQASESGKNTAALNESMAKWLTSLTKGVDLQKERKRLEEQWIQALLEAAKAQTEGNPNPVFVERMKQFKDQLEDFDKIFGPLMKAGDNVDDLKAKLAGLEAQLKLMREHSDSSKPQEVIARVTAELAAQEKLVNSKKKESDQLKVKIRIAELNIQLLDAESKLEEYITSLKQKQLENSQQLIDSVRDLNAALFDLRFERGTASLEDNFDRLNALYTNAVSKFKSSGAEIKRLQSSQFIGKDTASILEDNLSIQEEQKKQIINLQEIFNILRSIQQLPSQNFTEAWSRGFARLRRETEQWRDVLVDTILTASSSGIANIFDDIIHGTSSKKNQDINSQISDLNMQLEEARLKSAQLYGQVSDDQVQVTIQQNDQLKIMQQINDLEKQRVNILEQELMNVLDQVMKKLEDMAATKILDSLFGSTAITSNGKLDEYQKLIDSLFNSGGALFTGPPSPGSSVAPVGAIDYSGLQRDTYTTTSSNTFSPAIHFNGNVYGTDDFNKSVDKAIREIKRNLS